MWDKSMYNATFPAYSVMNARVNLHYWLSLALKLNVYEGSSDHTSTLLESMQKVQDVRERLSELSPLQKQLIELELAQLDASQDPDISESEVLKRELLCIAFRAQHMSEHDPNGYFESVIRLLDCLFLEDADAALHEFETVLHVNVAIESLVIQQEQVKSTLVKDLRMFVRHASPKTEKNAMFLGIEMKRKWIKILELTERLLREVYKTTGHMKDHVPARLILPVLMRDKLRMKVFNHTFKVLISHKVTMYYIMDTMLSADGKFPEKADEDSNPELVLESDHQE